MVWLLDLSFDLLWNWGEMIIQVRKREARQTEESKLIMFLRLSKDHPSWGLAHHLGTRHYHGPVALFAFSSLFPNPRNMDHEN